MATPAKVRQTLDQPSWNIEGEPGELTLLEMLDALETEIVQLRARNDQLAAALKKGSARKRKKSKGKAKAKVVTPRVIENASDTPPNERSVLGKRQALGRSILQLRRPT